MEQNSTAVRLTNTIFVSQSMLSASQIAIFTLMSIVAAQISGKESLAGTPSTALTLSQALMALPIGILMGRFGRRFGLTLSYGVSSLGALLGVLAVINGQFWLLLVSSMVIGMGRAGAEQSRYAAGDMFPEGTRARMIGRVVFAGTIGAIVGPSLVAPSSRLASVLDFSTNAGPWMLGTLLYAVAAVIIFFMLRPEPMTIAAAVSADEDAQAKAAGKSDEPDRTIGEMLRIPAVRLAIVAMLISQGTMVALMVITPLHMSHHNYGNGDVSIVIMAHTIGMFGLSSLTGYLIDRFGEVNTMVAGALTLIISAIIAPMSTQMGFLIVGLFLLGLGWNFGYIAGSSLLSKALRGAGRSRMQGLSDMLVAGAAATGSLSSGPIFEYGGYVAVAGTVIVVTLLLGYTLVLLGGQVRALRVSPQTG